MRGSLRDAAAGRSGRAHAVRAPRVVALLLLGLAVVLPSAFARGRAVTQDEVMYTLAVRFVGTEDHGSLHRTTSYVAQSVRPFLITKTPSKAGPVYRLEARVSGKLAHVGSGYHGGCTEAATRPVAGRVAVVPLIGARQNPAPLHLDIDPTPPTAIETCVGEDGGSTAWPIYTLLPQAPRWNGMLEFVETKPVDLGRSYGRKFTVAYRMDFVATVNGATRHYAWTLTFTPVRPAPESVRWQVEVQGRDLWDWGYTATGPGVWVAVDWSHTTVLAVKNGKVVSATGKVRALGTAWESDPAGVFAVTAKTKERPEYTLRPPQLGGSTLRLNLVDEPGGRATYRLDYAIALAGPDALDRMRAAGIPELAAQDVVADFTKGPLALFEVGSVPSSQGLTVTLRPGSEYRRPDGFGEKMPCGRFGSDAQHCFLTRGGERVTVTKLG